MGTSVRAILSAVAGLATVAGAFMLGYRQGTHVIEIRFVDKSATEMVNKFAAGETYTVTQSNG